MKKSLRYWYPLFLAPTLIAFAFAFIIPFAMGVWLSFNKFVVITNTTFAKFDNYITAFQDKDFLSAILFTTLFTICAIITVLFFAFTFSLILTKGIKGTNIFRSIFFLPNLIGGIVLGYIWNILINGILGWFELDITYSAVFGFTGLLAVINWQMIGYMMIIFIAGLLSVPTELKEAACIDGAKPIVVLFKVTIPMLMPTITICAFLTLSNSFKMFDQNLALTNGAPGNETTMIALNIYKTFYNKIGQEGVAQAKSVLFFILVGCIAFAQLVFTRSKEVEQ